MSHVRGQTLAFENGRLNNFLSQNDQRYLAQTFLISLLHLNEPAMLTPSHVEDFPLAEYAANYWFTHARATTNDVKK